MPHDIGNWQFVGPVVCLIYSFFRGTARRFTTRYLSRMNKTLLRYSCFLAALFVFACSKKELATPIANGVYTDPSGITLQLDSLQAHTASISPQRTTGLARQSIVLTAKLPDGRVLLVQYNVVQSVLPATASTLVIDRTPLASLSPRGKALISGYTDFTVSTGTLQLESSSPQLVAGTFSGPIEFNLFSPQLVPVSQVSFSHVQVQP